MRLWANQIKILWLPCCCLRRRDAASESDVVLAVSGSFTVAFVALYLSNIFQIFTIDLNKTRVKQKITLSSPWRMLSPIAMVWRDLMLHCSGPQIPGFPAHPCRPSADWKRNPEHAVTIFIYVFSSLEIMHGFWNLKRNPAKPTAVPRQFSDLWQKKSR